MIDPQQRAILTIALLAAYADGAGAESEHAALKRAAEAWGVGDAEIAAIGRAACLVEVRRLSDARAAATKGLASGFSSGSFRLILQKAESSLVATDTVDARNRWYRAGAPFSKSDARLRVPVLLLKPPASLAPRKLPESGAKTRGPVGRDP